MDVNHLRHWKLHELENLRPNLDIFSRRHVDLCDECIQDIATFVYDDSVAQFFNFTCKEQKIYKKKLTQANYEKNTMLITLLVLLH